MIDRVRAWAIVLVVGFLAAAPAGAAPAPKKPAPKPVEPAAAVAGDARLATLHRAAQVTSRDLEQLKRPPLVTATEDDLEVGATRPRLKAVAGTAAEWEPVKSIQAPLTQTPPVAGATFTAFADLDPQIAVGKQYGVISTYHEIGWFKKTETKLDKSTDAWTLFYPLVDPKNADNIDHHIHLPKDNCDPTGAGHTWDCTHEIYDLRVRYHGGHFFILAHTRNNTNRPGGAPAWNDLNRRSKNVLAVSIGENPNDGWNLFWWDEVVDDGACSDPAKCPADSPYTPGQACDYPSFSVDNGLLVQTDNVRGSKPYELIHIVPLDALTNPPAGAGPHEKQVTTLWHVKDAFGDRLTDYNLVPAQAHGTTTKHWFVYTTVHGSDYGLTVLHFDTASTKPHELHADFVATKPFGWAANSPQPDGKSTITYDNTGYFTYTAVVRDGKLFATLQDCKVWSGDSACTTSIRLVKIDVSGKKPVLEIDRTFGKHTASDDQSQPSVFYGNPGVEVTKKGDALLVYNRSSSKVPLEVRFSLYLHDGSDILPSRQLIPGGGSVSAKMDTAGISLDPEDDDVVWMAHDFAGKSGSGFAQTTVIGKTRLP